MITTLKRNTKTLILYCIIPLIHNSLETSATNDKYAIRKTSTSLKQPYQAANQFLPLLSNDIEPIPANFSIYLFETNLSTTNDTSTLSSEAENALVSSLERYLKECLFLEYGYSFNSIELYILLLQNVIIMKTNNVEDDKIMYYFHRNLQDFPSTGLSGLGAKLTGNVTFNYTPVFNEDDLSDVINDYIAQVLNDPSKNERFLDILYSYNVSEFENVYKVIATSDIDTANNNSTNEVNENNEAKTNVNTTNNDNLATVSPTQAQEINITIVPPSNISVTNITSPAQTTIDGIQKDTNSTKSIMISAIVTIIVVLLFLILLFIIRKKRKIRDDEEEYSTNQIIKFQKMSSNYNMESNIQDTTKSDAEPKKFENYYNDTIILSPNDSERSLPTSSKDDPDEIKDIETNNTISPPISFDDIRTNISNTNTNTFSFDEKHQDTGQSSSEYFTKKPIYFFPDSFQINTNSTDEDEKSKSTTTTMSSKRTVTNKQKITMDEFEQDWNDDLPFTWEPNNAPNGCANSMRSNNYYSTDETNTTNSDPYYSNHNINPYLNKDNEKGAFPSPTKDIHPLDWSNKSDVNEDTNTNITSLEDKQDNNFIISNLNNDRADLVFISSTTTTTNNTETNEISPNKINDTYYSNIYDSNIYRTEENISPNLAKAQYNSILGGIYIGEYNDSQQIIEYNNYNDNCEYTDDEDGEKEASRQFMNDLVWLEKRISEAREATINNTTSMYDDANNLQHNELNTKQYDDDDDSMYHEFINQQQKKQEQDTKLAIISSSNNNPNNANFIYKDIFAPAGKLYVYLTDDDESKPYVHDITKNISPLDNILMPNDYIISIDDTLVVDDGKVMHDANDVMNLLNDRIDYVRKIRILRYI